MQIDEFEKVRKQTSENQTSTKKQLKPIPEIDEINSIDFTSYLDTVEKKTLDK